MRLFISLIFLVIGTNLYSQKLLEFDFNHFGDEKKHTFIVAGYGACELCYEEIIDLFEKQEVDFNFLCVSENNVLLLSGNMKYHKYKDD